MHKHAGLPVLLPGVDADNGLKVCCHSLQLQRLTDVDQVEQVLLQGGTTKAYAGTQVLHAYACVCADGMRNLSAHTHGGDD